MQFTRFGITQTAGRQIPRTLTSLKLQGTRSFATSMSSDPNLRIENKNINVPPGIELNDDQKTLVGSVLDLFAGRPSLAKLRLWNDNAVFEDPLTVSKGREQYEPQWYGLQAAFSEIERLSHEVTSSGNPITMNLKTRYVVKGIGGEKTIDSKVNIFVGSNGKIDRVEDKWNGELPTGSIANAFRGLNAVTMPKIIKVPKTDEEDREMGN